jgi:hypothetical protein
LKEQNRSKRLVKQEPPEDDYSRSLNFVGLGSEAQQTDFIPYLSMEADGAHLLGQAKLGPTYQNPKRLCPSTRPKSSRLCRYQALNPFFSRASDLAPFLFPDLANSARLPAVPGGSLIFIIRPDDFPVFLTEVIGV